MNWLFAFNGLDDILLLAGDGDVDDIDMTLLFALLMRGLHSGVTNDIDMTLFFALMIVGVESR